MKYKNNKLLPTERLSAEFIWFNLQLTKLFKTDDKNNTNLEN